MRIALGLEYDGSAFCGWQTQPQGCGAQDALDRALTQLAGEQIVSACAGRTDAGVHALAQVVHFDTSAQRPLTAWVRGTNALLPDGMSVNWAKQMAEDFHARFSATGRRYVYWLLNRSQRPGLLHNRVGWFYQTLDVEAMRRAVPCLLGKHDFSAFRAAECQARTPVKELRQLDISRQGDMLRFDFAADAFLQHMVRNMIGSLVYIGAGRQPAEWLEVLLRGLNRTRAAPPFSPAGLYLAGVDYDPIWDLPSRPNARAIENSVLAAYG